MTIYNKSNDKDLLKGERLTKHYFWFLVDEYGFDYERYNFLSREMAIMFEIGHVTPRIFINQVGEPDFVRLNFEWIMTFFHGTAPADSRNYTKFSLEENMIFIAKIFRENSHKLIEEFHDWWIPAQVFMYHVREKKYEEAGDQKLFLTEYNEYFNYLRSKGAM